MIAFGIKYASIVFGKREREAEGLARKIQGSRKEIESGVRGSERGVRGVRGEYHGDKHFPTISIFNTWYLYIICRFFFPEQLFLSSGKL